MKTRRDKRSLNSRNKGEENSATIPLDLVIEILTRLPAKSIARFRCVSKLWGSTLLSPNFTDSFFTISLSRRKQLVTCLVDGKTLFFSSPKLQNSSSLATFHMSFPINFRYQICHPVRGLVCSLNKEILKGERVTTPLICNPSTGQSLTLPALKTRRNEVRSFLGYDPIDKQLKVLCMILPDNGFYVFEEHQILTLGTGKNLSWRMINCDITHSPVFVERLPRHYVYDDVCINGVLYYLAWVQGGHEFPDIVCFDIRYEKFKCIKTAHGMKESYKSILVNYKGKLAILQPNIVNRIYTDIQLCVLEDAEKHQWSRYIYALSPPWKNIYEENKLYFVGTTSSGDIVLSPTDKSDSYYLLYYNPERNTTKKVEIQGLEAYN